MQRAARWLGWFILAIPLLALAQAQPERELFLQPVVGTNAITLGWDKAAPFLGATSFTPSVRGGLLLPNLTLDTRLGLFTSGSPLGGYSGLSGLTLDAEVAPKIWGADRLRMYGLAGLGGGLLFEIGSRGSAWVPQTGLTLGGGLQYFLDPVLAVGAEVGTRTQLTFYNGGYLQPTTSIYVAFTGTWVRPWGLGLRPREPAPGGPPRPGTVSRPPDTSPPSDPPTAGDGPTPYGHSLTRCNAYVTDGWFEPTQGVWQDDPDFEDRRDKQLTRLPGDGVRYEAELSMVIGRDTLLFGVHHYRKKGEKVVVNSRDDIILRGVSNCTVPVPVKLKFTLHNPVGDNKLIYLSPVLGQIPLKGTPAPQYTPWEIKLPVGEGLPPDRTFKFTANLRHRIDATVIREDGTPTDLSMSVETYAVPTTGPKVHFVPVVIEWPDSNAQVSVLIRWTEALAKDTADMTPDFFPLRPGGLPTFVLPYRHFATHEIGKKWFEWRRIDATVAALNDTLSAPAFLDGAGRVVAVMHKRDFRAIFGAGAAGMTVASSVKVTPKEEEVERLGQARTLSWKVIMVPSLETWDTVAHELVHSLPEGWADSEMKKLCGRNYHNQKEYIANGIRITEAGVAGQRTRRNNRLPLMGPAVDPKNIWITQCTYKHLLDILLAGPPDPPVILVRAFVSRDGKQGELRPSYDLMGNSDLEPGKGGPYAFVLRDEKGTELGRYPFTPRFNDIETKQPREIASVVYRVPMVPGLARIELVGPGGVLDRRDRSAQPPSIRVRSPGEGEQVTPREGKVKVTWEGTANGSRTLLYSVSYSSDGGKNFLTQSFEQKGTELDVTISPTGEDHRVRIVATDGSRSAEVVIPLQVQQGKH